MMYVLYGIGILRFTAMVKNDKFIPGGYIRV